MCGTNRPGLTWRYDSIEYQIIFLKNVYLRRKIEKEFRAIGVISVACVSLRKTQNLFYMDLEHSCGKAILKAKGNLCGKSFHSSATGHAYVALEPWR